MFSITKLLKLLFHFSQINRITLYENLSLAPMAEWLMQWTHNPPYAGSSPAGCNIYLILLSQLGRTTGIEPANIGATIQCLTTWPRPPQEYYIK